MNRRSFLSSTLTSLATMPTGFAIAAEARKQIKITGIETDLLRLPPTPFTGDAIHDFGEANGAVVLRILTDAGITGWGYSNFAFIEGAPRVVQTILEHEIKPILVGQDPAFPKKIRADLWRALEYQGMQGLTQIALSAADIAIWDILGKAAGLPVYKMLGAYRDRMPAYAMCGWYRENDRDHSQYKRTINETLEQGYRAFKVKVGKFALEDDLERIEVGRKTAGKDIKIMVDANQVFTRPEALRRGRAYQEAGCFWFEEPLPPHDVEGFAEIARALDMRVATGENLYNKHAFMDLMERKGADVVQPDNRRAGGPTEWIEIGAISDAFGLELASHGGGPVNMNILCAIPNAIYMESSGKQNMVKGEVLAPEAPGMSSETAKDRIAKYKIG
ncbi:MAG TPA: mandelate racemase/muconate lactonizing enzyme family protein, partial [Bryobacteraceae bacterium]|nr:mandelate racemase/muconate lactonizing enzyme family protein [Bryobacteraceae bacterium]